MPVGSGSDGITTNTPRPADASRSAASADRAPAVSSTTRAAAGFRHHLLQEAGVAGGEKRELCSFQVPWLEEARFPLQPALRVELLDLGLHARTDHRDARAGHEEPLDAAPGHPATADHEDRLVLQLEEERIWFDHGSHGSSKTRPRDGLVRLSVGMEHMEDLIEDLEQALASV